MKRNTRSLVVLVTILVIAIVAAWLVITSGILAVVLDSDDETPTSMRVRALAS